MSNELKCSKCGTQLKLGEKDFSGLFTCPVCDVSEGGCRTDYRCGAYIALDWQSRALTAESALTEAQKEIELEIDERDGKIIGLINENKRYLEYNVKLRKEKSEMEAENAEIKQTARKELIEEIEKALPGKKLALYDGDEYNEKFNGFNDCLTEVKQILNSMKGVTK